MQIRKLVVDDYDKYLPLINTFRPTVFSQSEFAHILSKINKSGQIWIIEGDDGAFLATATIIYEHKFLWNTCIYAHIEDVCVRTDCRRGGYGKTIVTHLLREAKKHNCYKVTLDCSPENIPFYTACGLSPRGTQMCELVSNLVL